MSVTARMSRPRRVRIRQQACRGRQSPSAEPTSRATRGCGAGCTLFTPSMPARQERPGWHVGRDGARAVLPQRGGPGTDVHAELTARARCRVRGSRSTPRRGPWGESRALVLRGEPGIGKSALLSTWWERIWMSGGASSGRRGRDGTCIRGLHQLCAPSHPRAFARAATRRARESAGPKAGPPPDRFLVALAALGLLAEVAEAYPLTVWSTTPSGWTRRPSCHAPSLRAACWRKGSG